MLTILKFAVLFAFTNRLWGSGWFKGNKIASVILTGIGIGTILFFEELSLLTVTISSLLGAGLYYFGRIWGHGAYFCTFNPEIRRVGEKEIGWIDAIADKFVPIEDTNTRKMKWCTIGMTLRGAYYMPLIAAISFFNINALFFVPGVFLIGFAYWIQRFQSKHMMYAQWQLPFAEVFWGFILGTLVGCAFVI